MELGRKHINWVRIVCAVPLVLCALGGLASPVNGQLAANRAANRILASVPASGQHGHER